MDGPLTRAVRGGSICYLDEIVEARKDTTVIIHSLTDHRRMLPIEKTGELLAPHSDFLLVISYNPGYQSVLKDLKPRTRQRFVASRSTIPTPTRSDDHRARERRRCGHRERLAVIGAKTRQLAITVSTKASARAC